MKSRALNIMGLLLNLAVIACFGVGIYLYNGSFEWADLRYFSILTAFVTLLASLLMLVPNIVSIKTNRPSTPKLFFSLRFFSAVMSAVTLITILAFVCPKEVDGFKQLFSLTNGNLLFFFVIPVISIFMFMFIEIQKKERFGSTFAPLVFSLLYLIGIFVPLFLILNSKGVDAAVEFAPASYFCVTKELADAWNKVHGSNIDATRNIIICAIIFLGTYAISILLFVFNRITYAIFVGVEYKDKKEIERERAERLANKKNLTRSQRFKNYLKSEVSFKDVNYAELNHVYHVSYQNRKLKTWKVKSASAGRALKIFNTQQEAIDFAKQQVALHGGSIRIHSMTGAMRKQNKWDTINAGKEVTPVANKVAHKKVETKTATPVKKAPTAKKPVAKNATIKKAPAKKKKK